jgi:hypothetical protein
MSHQQQITINFVFEFRMILNVNSDYFLKQRQPVDLCNGEVWCFLCSTVWILKCYLYELRLQCVKYKTDGKERSLWLSALQHRFPCSVSSMGENCVNNPKETSNLVWWLATSLCDARVTGLSMRQRDEWIDLRGHVTLPQQACGRGYWLHVWHFRILKNCSNTDIYTEINKSHV